MRTPFLASLSCSRCMKQLPSRLIILCLIALLLTSRCGGAGDSVDSHAFMACEAVRSLSGRALLDWLNRHGEPEASTHVLVISFATMDIVDSYAKFALATNYLWAKERGYCFHVFHERIDPDPRWNKVKLLADIFDGTRAEYSNISSVVWVDADLAVVQFSLSIESLQASYPQSDLIMSRDKATAPFVGNTGFLLARRSDWTLAFLRRWWSYDRARCCDQHALTWMYDEGVPEDRSRLLLLPANDLNTDFPAWLTFDSSSRVLHLAGLPTFYRVTVFSFAFSSLCPPARLEQQLGITRDYLQQAVCKLRMQRGHLLRNVHSQFLSSSYSSYSLGSLQKLRQEVLDIMKTDNDEFPVTCPPLPAEDVFALHATAMQDIYHALYPLLSSALSQPWGANHTAYDLLIDTSSACIEMVLAQLRAKLAVSRDDMHTLDEALRSVVEMQEGLPKGLQGRLLYYRFKLAQIQAESCLARECRLDWLREGENRWREMTERTGYHGTEYASAEPMKEFTELLVEKGSLLCLQGRFREGLADLRESVSLQAEVVTSLERLRIATTDIVALARQSYSDILYNAGLCSVEWLETEPGGAITTAEAATWLAACREGAKRLEEEGRRAVEERLKALHERLEILSSTSSSSPQDVSHTCSGNSQPTPSLHSSTATGKTKRFRRRVHSR